MNKPGIAFTEDQERLIKSFIDADAVMRRFADDVSATVDGLADGLRVQAEILHKGLEDAGLFVSITFDESVYRAYATRLNWRRRYRKVSWRRLNRRQRLEAEASALRKA